MSRTAEQWGRLAVSLPGWRWMPGMLTAHGRICGAGYLVSDDIDESGQPYVDCTDSTNDWTELAPDPDDPATAGALLALLGGAVDLRIGSRRNVAPWVHECIVGEDQSHDGRIHTVRQPTIGRLCIAVAAALGRWPNGGQMVAE